MDGKAKGKHKILPKDTPEGFEERQTPPGQRQDPQNKKERAKAAAEAEQPDHEKYTGTTDGTPVGQPVGAAGTTSGREKELKEGVLQREQFDTVVEGQLGGGEKTIYSAKDGPPLDAQDPTPRS
ncbi:hypothetical protein CVIRNUC_010974 [Coccomyxa viridis]|uniref:Uncharacterized protein n=1 Tax=Coccomyxa viridis TaxID=1274662 RepID=A0AAV1IND5_9CHLO|nr:hypothetical protein CVIRNUC_010974 [Coccomyxa viridis]